MFEELSNFRNALPSLKSFRNLSPLARRELKWGMLFLSPWIIGFLAFTLIPMLATLFFSFLNLKITDGIFSKPDFAGLANYIHLFKDPQVWSTSTTPGSLWITIKFGLIALPVGIFVPLGIALLMNSPHLKGQNAFRNLLYMQF